MTDDVVYVTKYALSDGIRECRVVKRHPPYLYVEWSAEARGYVQLREDEAWPTFEAAKNDAIERRASKILSLRKQIAKLEGLTWKEPKRTKKETT